MYSLKITFSGYSDQYNIKYPVFELLIDPVHYAVHTKPPVSNFTEYQHIIANKNDVYFRIGKTYLTLLRAEGKLSLLNSPIPINTTRSDRTRYLGDSMKNLFRITAGFSLV